jgi:hypothetical protein
VINFYWIIFVMLTSVALGAFVHILALPVPMFIWMVVSFVQAGWARKRRIRELEEELSQEEDDGRA